MLLRLGRTAEDGVPKQSHRCQPRNGPQRHPTTRMEPPRHSVEQKNQTKNHTCLAALTNNLKQFSGRTGLGHWKTRRRSRVEGVATEETWQEGGQSRAGTVPGLGLGAGGLGTAALGRWLTNTFSVSGFTKILAIIQTKTI